MASDTDSEMKNLNTSSTLDIENYRKLVQSYLNLHLYEAALFWADKVVALTNSNAKDVYWLAQCMFHLKQYHRAAHLLRMKNLDQTHVPCNYLVVKCLLEAHEYNEALKVVRLLDGDMFLNTQNSCTVALLENGLLFDDTPKAQMQSAVYLIKAKVLEAMDNRGLAADYYKKALQSDVYCYEAFECLTQHNMLSAEEEHDLINSLPFTQQCSHEETEVLLLLYRNKLKKYNVPTGDLSNMFEVCIEEEVSTPLTANVVNPIITTPDVKPMEYVISNTPLISRLHDSLDMVVAKAEQLYYNCDYQKCLALTESILKQDPYHSACLPIHISCIVELKQSNKLFTLAHKLVELYPNLAISWYAVGCYYYIIDKCDSARRYLAKATSLDRLFGPAWLAYGHSFAIENEHDQAMAAYFKASQLMKGCHLPLMYIGLECGLTNNMRLAEKFFRQANKIAPDDPFVLHERGVVAFHNQDYHLAESYYRTALKIIKSRKCTLLPEQWAPLHNNLGHALRKQKNYKQALQQHHKALVLTPQNSNIYSDIAFVHALMNNMEEAADWFHRALGLRRDDTFSTTMLGLVIEQLYEEQDPYPGAPEGIPSFRSFSHTDDISNSPNESNEYEME